MNKSGMKQALTRVNLYEQVANEIEKMIVENNPAICLEGDRLPSEQDLANDFSVSRNVIREAIKILKERGLVNPRNGLGAYITKPDITNLTSQVSRYMMMNDFDLRDIYDTRIMIETQCAAAAAERITPEKLQDLKAKLKQLEDQSISVEDRRSLDFDFHVAISKAAGNHLNTTLMILLKEIFISTIEKGIFNEGGIEDAKNRHQLILKALENHDSMKAREAMREHLEVSMEMVLTFYKSEE